MPALWVQGHEIATLGVAPVKGTGLAVSAKWHGNECGCDSSAAKPKSRQ